MKKALWKTVVVSLICVVALSACNQDNLPQMPSTTTPPSTNPDTHIHTFGPWTTVQAATCSAKGKQERSCSCGETEFQTIDFADHTDGEWVTNAATCTSDGSKQLICSVCSATIKSEPIATKGHQYSQNIVNSNCSSSGKKVFTCNDCDHAYEEEIQPIALSFKGNGASPLRKYTVTTRGGYGTVLINFELYSSADATEPVSTTDFSSNTTISVSFSQYANVIDNFVYQITAKDEIGNISIYRFRLKDESQLDFVQTSQTDHHFSDWVVTKAPTAYEHGARQRTCLVCRMALTEIILSNESILSYKVNADKTSCTITGIKELRNPNIIIPETLDGYTVTQIEVNAFQGAKITSICIPDSVSKIGSQAFENCNTLRNITIGKGVANIGPFAFRGCTALLSITVDDANTYYKSIDGNLYTKDGREFIQYALGKSDTGFVVPQGVETIASYAFYRCTYIQKITLPHSMTMIGWGAFQLCKNLTTINIPGNTYRITANAFSDCAKLSSVTFESTGGWFAVLSAGLEKTVTFTSNEISDSAIMAQYLRDDYRDYHLTTTDDWL